MAENERRSDYLELPRLIREEVGSCQLAMVDKLRLIVHETVSEPLADVKKSNALLTQKVEAVEKTIADKLGNGIDRRVRVLENWRYWLLGAIAALGAGVSIYISLVH